LAVNAQKKDTDTPVQMPKVIVQRWLPKLGLYLQGLPGRSPSQPTKGDGAEDGIQVTLYRPMIHHTILD